MHGLELRRLVLNEEIDYVQLKSLLPYSQPRNKINRLLRDGSLIRVKKGLYVFGPNIANGPICKETLANLIYGPSAISLEYALGFYGLIPERVETITSITPLRNKNFTTPVGHFSYRYLALHKYAIGITQYLLNKTHKILIATPEKALADLLILSKPLLKIKNQQELLNLLLNNLRINEEKLYQLDPQKIFAINQVYASHACHLLHQLLTEKLKK